MKPEIKKEVAVTWHNKTLRFIKIYCTTDALEDFKCFGDYHHIIGSEYIFTIDARYDWDEVLNYMENYDG